MAETLRERRVRGYALAIYIDGTRKFADTPADFHQEIKTYAATHFTMAQIDDAFATGKITDQEYRDTLELVPAA